jgi:hypothetical protein
MVCMREHKSEIEKKNPFMLSDMRGAYLSRPTLDIYNRFSLISSHNLSNFNIELNDSKYKEMRFILNGLQKQGFQINKKILVFIKKNRATFEKSRSSYAWKTSTRESERSLRLSEDILFPE